MIPVVPRKFPDVTNQTDALHKVKLKRWLGARTISSVTWSTTPTGPTFHDQDDTLDTSTTAGVWIKNFTAGVDYIIRGKVTASDNEIEEVRVRVRCRGNDETE